jgi:hypothetical protein
LSLQVDYAVVHAGLGEVEQALQYLEEAGRRRLGDMLHAVHGIMWQPLRRDPRFWEMVERIGLGQLARTRTEGEQT